MSDLDFCQVCGGKVKDFEPGGYEREGDGQRGHVACDAREPTCCDGTGWTGNPRERCVDHYEAPGFGAAGMYS